MKFNQIIKKLKVKLQVWISLRKSIYPLQNLSQELMRLFNIKDWCCVPLVQERKFKKLKMLISVLNAMERVSIPTSSERFVCNVWAPEFNQFHVKLVMEMESNKTLWLCPSLFQKVWIPECSWESETKDIKLSMENSAIWYLRCRWNLIHNSKELILIFIVWYKSL
jgi:hypothetical protein